MPILWYVINCWFSRNLYVLKGFVLIKNWGIYEIEDWRLKREREKERERRLKKKDESEEKNKRIYK